MEEIVTFSEESINSLNCNQETKDLLKKGLPDEAQPFIVFGSPTGANLQSVVQDFGLNSQFDVYKIIGFNSYGDPICIDEKDNSIVYLNHDDNFGIVYINNSLNVFLKCLDLFKDLILFKNNNSKLQTRKQVVLTKNEFLKLDKKCLANGFWEIELGAILDEYSFGNMLKNVFKKST